MSVFIGPGDLQMPTDVSVLLGGAVMGVAILVAAVIMLRERARRAMAARLSALAHDLRTPLSAITAFGELLDEEDDPMERARFTGIIREEASRIDAMISAQLGGSRRPADSNPDGRKFRPAAGRSILVVDDDRFIVEATRRLLEKEGYRATAAGGGEEALKFARDCQPDLILMDLAMPAMGGGEALRLLRLNPDTRRIPVIITTGDGEAAPPEGADAVLVKPIARTALLTAVARALAPGAPA